MLQHILKEGVLNDDFITFVTDKKESLINGKFIAIITAYTFKNAWANNENVIGFTAYKDVIKYIGDNYDIEVLENIDLSELYYYCKQNHVDKLLTLLTNN